MMLRRLKEDVEKSLAPKEETIVEVELTNIQKKVSSPQNKVSFYYARSVLKPNSYSLLISSLQYYRAILERNFQFLSKGSTSNANVPNLMNTMMELRKCCNHP